jgi:guanylate kinase
LHRRNTDAEDVCQRRLSVARQEIAQCRQFDYLVISATVAEDVRRVGAILTAEQSRQTRVRAPELD